MSSTYDHGGNVFDMAGKLGVPLSELVDFSASINPLGMSARVRDAVIAALDSIVHYPDHSHLELKQALARHHGVSPSAIAVANGSTELIYRLPAMLTGQRALIVSPAFSEYAHALDQHQWESRPFILSPANGFALDLQALERALSDGCDVLYLCNPGNPSGALYPPEVMERVQGLCAAAGTILVLDEAFMDFCEEASAKHFIATGDNGICLRSMTKFFAIPGLRLGYAIACPDLAQRLDAVGGPWSVNTLALAAGVAALHDAEYQKMTIAVVQRERSRLSEQLARFPMLTVYPSDANFLLLELRGGLTAMELRERLLGMGMIIRDCSNFTGLSAQFFRIAVRTEQENQRLVNGLRQILGG